jgi:antirestriction protein ArdC
MVVFNAADLVGDRQGSKALAERIGRCRATARSSAPERDERLQRAESVLAAWAVERSSGGDRAFYNPWLDRIQLPEAHRFCSEAARLATWAHEAIHSTGHPSRLGRNLSAPFGSAPYAREELVAELGAVLLGERLAIGSETANHAAYLKHWCELLRQEPRLLLQVLGEARRAADLIAPEAEHAA